MRSAVRAGGRLLNHFLSRAGFKVVRLPALQRPINDQRISGRFVECIGPSGIGKTTAIKAFRSMSKYQWSYDYSEPKTVLADKGLLSHDVNLIYKKLLFNKIKFIISSNYSTQHIFGLVAFMSTRLQQDYTLMQSGYLSNGGVWWDDGIFHNFTNQIKDELVESESIPEPFKGRTLINFTAPIPIIIERLRKRNDESQGALNDWFGIDGADSVGVRIANSLAAKEQLMSIWTDLGGQGFVVDLSSTEKAVEKLLTIEQELVRGRSR